MLSAAATVIAAFIPIFGIWGGEALDGALYYTFSIMPIYVTQQSAGPLAFSSPTVIDAPIDVLGSTALLLMEDLVLFIAALPVFIGVILDRENSNTICSISLIGVVPPVAIQLVRVSNRYLWLAVPWLCIATAIQLRKYLQG
jgi:hypothetical protein